MQCAGSMVSRVKTDWFWAHEYMWPWSAQIERSVHGMEIIAGSVSVDGFSARMFVLRQFSWLEQ